MTFRKLTEKETALVSKHRDKYGSRSANVYRANIMRGKTHKESEKLAKEKAPNLPPRRERRKKLKVDIEPVETKPIETEPVEYNEEV